MFAPSWKADQILQGWFDVGYEQCADEAIGFLLQYLEPRDDVIQGLRGHLQQRNPLHHQEWHQQQQCCYNRHKHGTPLNVAHVSRSSEPHLFELRLSTTPERSMCFSPAWWMGMGSLKAGSRSQLFPQETNPADQITNGKQISPDRDIGFSQCCNPVFFHSPTAPTCRPNPLMSCTHQPEFHHFCYSAEYDKSQIVPLDQTNMSPTSDALCNSAVTENELSSLETSLSTDDDAFITSCNNNDVTKRLRYKTLCNYCDRKTFDCLSTNAAVEPLDVQSLIGDKKANCGGDTALIDNAAELLGLAVNNTKVLKLLEELFSLMDENEMDEEMDAS